MAERIAARSTMAGTPVKSWRMTRAGLKGTSRAAGFLAFQPAKAATSCSVTSAPSQFRSTDSSKTLIEEWKTRNAAQPGFLQTFQAINDGAAAAQSSTVRAPKASSSSSPVS